MNKFESLLHPHQRDALALISDTHGKMPDAVESSKQSVLAPIPAMAKDSYVTETCSALLGTYLFEHGRKIARADCQKGDHLQLCIGSRKWVQCPDGLPDVFRILDTTDTGGTMRSLPDDWGVVANSSGEILYRAITFVMVREVRYLGREDAELATTRLTIHEAGIAPSETPT